jgi:hypothetical protein
LEAEPDGAVEAAGPWAPDEGAESAAAAREAQRDARPLPGAVVPEALPVAAAAPLRDAAAAAALQTRASRRRVRPERRAAEFERAA